MSSENDSRNNAPGNHNGHAGTEEELAQARQELEKAKNEYLYLRAEFDNFRKQTIKERSELLKYGGERLVVALLDVMDNFERALQTEVTSENFEGFTQGIRLTAEELRGVLERNGVKSIEAQGQPFDPSLHEALSSEETDDVAPGHITRVFRKAYKLHDRVIRPAQVVVARESSGTDKDAN